MSANRPPQLPLELSLQAGGRFEDFVAADNETPVAMLRALADGQADPFTYLTGPQGTGKTHLLHAVAHARQQQTGDSVAVIPASLLSRQESLHWVAELQPYPLVLVDDFDLVVGDATGEEVLFSLFNTVRDAGHQLLLASRWTPEALPIKLPDLRSRLLSGVLVRLQRPGDEALNRCLKDMASARGMEISDEVAAYVLKRLPRQAGDVARFVQSLDRLSLAVQRRPTIPLVKSLFDESAEDI